MAAQRPEEALVSLEKSLAIEPKNPDTLCSEPISCFGSSVYSNALLVYEAFLGVDTNYSRLGT
jgi:hypothetical protein